MYISPTITPPKISVPNNPTDEQRHRMLYDTLDKAGRAIDYDNIVNLLSPPEDITQYGKPGEFRNIKVAILGAGLAGLSAAFELRKLGYDITIFEPMTERIGGRVYTYYFDEEKKLYGELGAMRIPASHETTWHYINLFGLDTESFISADANAFRYVRGVRVRDNPENIFRFIYPKFDLNARERNTPWPRLYNQISNYYFSIMPPEVRKQFLMIMPRYDVLYEYIESINLHQAMEKYGLSEEAINLIGGVMPTNQALMFHSYEVTLSDEYSMDFMNVYRISGGMVNLPLAFYNSLVSQFPSEYKDIPRGAAGTVHWRRGFIATGISRPESGRSVMITFRSVDKEDYKTEKFDYVICATPFPLLRALNLDPQFSDRKMAAIKGAFYEDAQKTLFLCKERFWERQGIFGGTSYSDEIIQIVHYPKDHVYCKQDNINYCPDEPGVLLASYNIGEDAFALGNMESLEQFAAIKRKIERLHRLPLGYLNDIVMDKKTVDWVREPWFYGAFQMFMPGQKKDFLYVSSTPEYSNRVFFAGEHTSAKNGWMQGALQSGMRAANEVAYYSSLDKKLR